MDLQSTPFSRSGTPPICAVTQPAPTDAGGGTRTPNLLIINQLLCQLSHTSEPRSGRQTTRGNHLVKEPTPNLGFYAGKKLRDEQASIATGVKSVK